MHLFCLKDKDRSLNCVFLLLLAKVPFTLRLLRVNPRSAESRGFLCVLRFLPTKNVDRVVEIMKIWTNPLKPF